MINVTYCGTSDDSLEVLFNGIGESLEGIKAARMSGTFENEGQGFSDASGNGFNKSPGFKTPGQILLIVPAQFTLEAEEAAFRYLGGRGFFDLQIMSNNKLAQNILRETGSMGVTPISRLGRSMLVRKTIREHESELKAFRSVAADKAFIDMAGDFVLQMKQNNIGQKELDSIIKGVPDVSLLSRKLRDMQVISASVNAAMEGKYNDGEDLRRFVTARVKESQYIKNSEIWFYGFYSFTARDMEFLGELAKYSQGLNVQLLMDDSGSEWCEASRRTFRRLKLEAEKQGLEFRSGLCRSKESREPRERHVVRCASTFTEAETIAAQILSMVRDSGYHYGDFAVLTGDDSLAESLRRTFDLYGIPVFEDRKRSVLHTNSIELLTAALDICADGMRQQSVLRFLKSGVSGFGDENLINDFDNYVKQYHINEERFGVPFKYGRAAMGEERFAALEGLRSQLYESLSGLTKAFSGAVMDGKSQGAFGSSESNPGAGKSAVGSGKPEAQSCDATTAGEKTGALRSYLESIGLKDRLQATSISLAEDGLLDASEEIAQMWELIMSLFDQITELIGGEAVSPEEYREILTDSFGDIKVGLLPQSEGKLIIGDIYRTRLNNVRVLFIAGFNDGQIPRSQDSEGILTDREMENLEKSGVSIIKRGIRLEEEDRLIVRSAFYAPTESLWICYSMSDSEGTSLGPSTMLSSVLGEYGLREEEDIENDEGTLQFIQSPTFSMRHLCNALRAYKAGEALAPEWMAAFNYLKDKGDNRLTAIGEGLLFNNKLGSLGRDEAKELYGFASEAARGVSGQTGLNSDAADGAAGETRPNSDSAHESVGRPGLNSDSADESVGQTGLNSDAAQEPVGHPGSNSDAAHGAFNEGIKSDRGSSVSPSRIERFAGCPFRHFVSYGLRPDEQRSFEMGNAELGTVYHEVVQRLCDELSEPARKGGFALSDSRSRWMSITDEELEAMVSRILDSVAEDSMEGLLRLGGSEEYKLSRLRKVCNSFAMQLVRQVRAGQVRDMFLETGFGSGRKLPPVRIETSFGVFRIEGKIDRIDVMDIGGQEYIKIIDYKSGARSFNRESAEKGLAVQLMVYLEGACEGREGAKPAGVFYSLIGEYTDSVSVDKIDADETAAEVAEYFARKYRLGGMVVADEKIVRGIDGDALEGNGRVLAVKKNKDGELTAGAGTELAGEEEFAEFRSKVKGAIVEICERLGSGEIAVAPQKSPGRSGSLPCQYCDYRSICLFEK